MAKGKDNNSNKIVFGVRRKNKAKKSRGPKDKNVKKYKGQGR